MILAPETRLRRTAGIWFRNMQHTQMPSSPPAVLSQPLSMMTNAATVLCCSVIKQSLGVKTPNRLTGHEKTSSPLCDFKKRNTYATLITVLKTEKYFSLLASKISWELKCNFSQPFLSGLVCFFMPQIMTVQGNWRYRTRMKGKGRLHYLSKAPFSNGPQYLKVVKIHCEKTEREKDTVSMTSAMFQDKQFITHKTFNNTKKQKME